ncbi:hypothetical protein [Achromobacter aegrifaciens]
MAIIRPTNFQIPFADGGGKNSIPIPSSTTPGAASFTDGFPPATRTPLVAGGIPPSGLDMNGILWAISQHTVFQNAGGRYRFDAALAAANGGYPVGFVLQSDDGLNEYVNVLAGNTTNFNTTPASIGVSWLPWSGSRASVGRLLAVRVFSSPGAVTYTPTTGTSFVRVRMQAGGGAGGGAVVTNASQVSVGVGGSGGSYGEAVITSGFAGVTITTGAGGTPVSGGNGGAGGSSSFGSLLTVPGGVGGVFGPAATPSPLAGQNPPTTAPTGASVAIRGEGGHGGVASSATVAQGGRGGQSAFGVGGQLSSPAFAGNPALNRGAGGGSAANVNSAAATFPGGAGGDGITIVEEYSL